MTTSLWVLALQVHHAIKKDDHEDTSILGEIRNTHDVTRYGTPVCGIVPLSETQSWVIPARGTAEYNEVRHIYDALKENGEMEESARELLRLQVKNREWREHLNSPKPPSAKSETRHQ